MSDDTVFTRWRSALERWAIPTEILDRAPQSPWIHPVDSFRPKGDLHVQVPSRLRALEVLTGDDPSVLDVGCGGGRAAFGLVPPATRLVGVDHQQGMLDVFATEATSRGVSATTVLGDWPDVADVTPICDVVVCHHVFYNVQDLRPFIQALHEHAAKRVVVELPLLHPLSNLSPAWRHFWNLERPTSPSADDALACVRSMGIDAHLETFAVEGWGQTEITEAEIANTRIRLCLTPDRDADVRDFLEKNPRTRRDLATIWWDV